MKRWEATRRWDNTFVWRESDLTQWQGWLFRTKDVADVFNMAPNGVMVVAERLRRNHLVMLVGGIPFREQEFHSSFVPVLAPQQGWVFHLDLVPVLSPTGEGMEE